MVMTLFKDEKTRYSYKDTSSKPHKYANIIYCTTEVRDYILMLLTAGNNNVNIKGGRLKNTFYM